MKTTEASMKQKRKEPEEPGVNQNKRGEGLRTISSRSAISGIFHLSIESLCSFVELTKVHRAGTSADTAPLRCIPECRKTSRWSRSG